MCIYVYMYMYVMSNVSYFCLRAKDMENARLATDPDHPEILHQRLRFEIYGHSEELVETLRYICMYKFLYVYTYIYIYIYMYIYTYTYVYT